MYNRSERWVNGLDSIRFILAFIVMLSHLHNPFNALLRSSGNIVANFGGVVLQHMFPGIAAVSAFFIVSGFVIHYAHMQQPQFNWKSFLVRRWVRVGVPMFLVTLLSGIYNVHILAIIWSLYCELIFYTLYPLLCRLKVKWDTLLVFASILSAIVMSVLVLTEKRFLHLPFLSGRGIGWRLVITAAYLPVWLSGVVLAERINVQERVTDSALWASRVVAYLCGIAVVGLKMQLHINALYTSVLIAPVLYIWLRNEIVHYATHTPLKAIENAGQFSYSLYLWHLFIFTLLKLVWPLTTSSYFIYLFSAIALSYVAYILVERPSHMLARRLAKVIS